MKLSCLTWNFRKKAFVSGTNRISRLLRMWFLLGVCCSLARCWMKRRKLLHYSAVGDFGRSAASCNHFHDVYADVWTLDEASRKRNNIKFARAWHTIWFYIGGTVPFYAMLPFCRHCRNVRAAWFNISSSFSKRNSSQACDLQSKLKLHVSISFTFFLLTPSLSTHFNNVFDAEENCHCTTDGFGWGPYYVVSWIAMGQSIGSWSTYYSLFFFLFSPFIRC